VSECENPKLPQPNGLAICGSRLLKRSDFDRGDHIKHLGTKKSKRLSDMLTASGTTESKRVDTLDTKYRRAPNRVCLCPAERRVSVGLEKP